MLSTSFPPDPDGRAERVGTRVKYLVQETDWEPVIVLPMGSDAIHAEVGGQDITVYRSAVDEDGDESGDPDLVGALLNDPNALRKVYRGSTTERAIKIFESTLTPFPFPDTYGLYLPSIVRKVTSLVAKEDIDLLYTMCYPFTFHVAGRLTKRLSEIPWIAEFRDPWVTNPRVFDGRAGTFNRYLERVTVEHADRIVYNYGIQVPDGYFTETYPDHANRVERIDCPGATGFDFEKLSSTSSLSEHFNIIYGGSFYGSKHTPEPFLEGLAQFIERTTFKTDPVVNFFGDWRPAFDEVVESLGLEQYVEPHDWIDPAEFFERIQNAHISLFIVRPYKGDEWNVPQKITDYLATETPILALCDPNWEAAKFIQRNDIGVATDPSDPAAIRAGLETLYGLYQRDELDTKTASRSLLDSVNARQLARQFGTTMNEAFEEGRSGRLQ